MNRTSRPACGPTAALGALRRQPWRVALGAAIALALLLSISGRPGRLWFRQRRRTTSTTGPACCRRALSRPRTSTWNTCRAPPASPRSTSSSCRARRTATSKPSASTPRRPGRSAPAAPTTGWRCSFFRASPDAPRGGLRARIRAHRCAGEQPALGGGDHSITHSSCKPAETPVHTLKPILSTRTTQQRSSPSLLNIHGAQRCCKPQLPASHMVQQPVPWRSRQPTS